MVTARANLHPWKSTTERHARRMDGGRMRGKRTPVEIQGMIRELLISGLSVEDVLVKIQQSGYPMQSRGPIDRERVRLNLDVKLGRPPGPTTSKYLDAVVILKNNGLNPTEIARQLGVSRQTVYDCLKAYRREEKT